MEDSNSDDAAHPLNGGGGALGVAQQQQQQQGNGAEGILPESRVRTYRNSQSFSKKALGCSMEWDGA